VLYAGSLLLEEYMVTLEQVPEKKNDVVDALSYLEIDIVKIPIDEVLTLLSKLAHIKFPFFSTKA
jgi:hypothetical protein